MTGYNKTNKEAEPLGRGKDQGASMDTKTGTTKTETEATITKIADQVAANYARAYTNIQTNAFGGLDLGRDGLIRLYTDDTTIELVAFDPTRPAAKIIAWSLSFNPGTPDAIIRDALDTAIAWAHAGWMQNTATPMASTYA